MTMRIFVAIFAIFFFFPLPAHAEDYRVPIIQAARHWRVPAKLALAVARVESGLNPWAVNVAGRGYMPKSHEEASQLVEEAWAAGLSCDIGLMQINSYWMRRYGLEPQMLLSPHQNAIMGVRKFGWTWHSPRGRYQKH